jgi:hypothetical protein
LDIFLQRAQGLGRAIQDYGYAAKNGTTVANPNNANPKRHKQYWVEVYLFYNTQLNMSFLYLTL